MVETINDANIDSVLKENEIAVIDFWAPWCGPCRMLGPIVEQVASDNEDVLVAKINVDENPDLSQKYEVRGIPTMIFLKGGEIVDKIVGVVPAEKIQSVIDGLK